MADQSSSSLPGPNTLVIRAAFVPDGEQPPPEFDINSNPIRFPATLDPNTGAITCDSAGVNFGGDILAEWHPDEDQDEEDELSPDSSPGPKASGG